MSNPYYNHTSGVPSTLTRGTSDLIRAEYDDIGVGFDSVYTQITALAAAVGIPVTVTEVPVASAATTDIGNGYGPVISITGTTTITSLGTNYISPIFVKFAGALTLTHSATLVCPGAENIVTEAGDVCIASPLGNPAGGWRITHYARMSKGVIYDTLASTTAGKGASLVKFESGSTVQDLASTATGKGATLISADDGASGSIWTTAQGALDTVDVKFANYTALRAYTGTRHVTCRITASGVAGFFYYDSTDVTSADNGGTIIVDASSRRWKRFYAGDIRAEWFATGDNVTDDATTLNKCFAAQSSFGGIDLGSKTYRITAPIARPAVGVKIRNGRIRLDNNASNQFYALVANDFCDFDNIYFLGAGVTGSGGVAKYQGGIFGGNTAYASPMNTVPANYVTVRGCTFDSLTVGVWSGGDTLDAVPVGWHVTDNNLVDIVGLAGLSEGYGILFTPSSNGTIRGNTFKTIRRHAIYLASEASNNTVSQNVIDGCDNIAIQSNTGATQNYADGNVITNNTIKGLTRSIAYGYRSSIGIGLYGKFKNCVVNDNRIYGALDTGIDLACELNPTAYATAIAVQNNQIIMDSTATDAGIRVDGLLSGKVSGNDIYLTGAIYGIVATSTYTSGTDVIDISENTVHTTNAAAIAFRTALVAARVLRIFRNTLIGFTNAYANRITDASSAGTIRTDLNSNTGYVATDAAFTHAANGITAELDCRTIRHAGVLTADRILTLTNTTSEVGAEVTIMRTGAGAFSLNVTDGSTIKGLATGTWGRFVWNNGAGWELASYGSL